MSAFEARYAADPDPWRTLSDPYELEKAQRTLAACGPGPFAAACELGAGVGALTAQLAPRCEQLVALDGAPSAVAEAVQRLAPFAHAEARVAMVPDDLPDGTFDLILASEILYYLDDGALAATAAWCDRALRPNGRVVVVHWTGSAPDIRQDPAAVAAALAAAGGLALAAESAVYLGYRIDVLVREAGA
jgi:SAM-dependent methyltransferase